jgi:hypothetical protein
LGFALLGLALTACRPLTYVEVVIDNAELTVPTEVQSLQVTVTNPGGGDGGELSYQSQSLRLCAPGESLGCYTFPISVTLIPGPTKPDAPTRVQVDGYDAAGVRVFSDASVFSFAPEVGEELRFHLFRSCLHTECSAIDQACGSTGACGTVRPGQRLAAPPSPPPAPQSSVVRVAALAGDAIGVMNAAVPPPAAAQPGDLVVVMMTGAITQSAPDGWTQVALVDQTAVYYRRADAGETTNVARYQFAANLGQANLHWILLVYRGVAQVVPIASGQLPGPPYAFSGSAPIADSAVLCDLFASNVDQCVPPRGGGDQVQGVGVYALDLFPPRDPASVMAPFGCPQVPPATLEYFELALLSN